MLGALVLDVYFYLNRKLARHQCSCSSAGSKATFCASSHSDTRV